MLITGGNAGLGLETAVALAALGAADKLIGGAGDQRATGGQRRGDARLLLGHAEVAEVEQGSERVKVNPLVEWTWGDVWHFIARHQLDYNALHDRFFPSIGCVPCTRAIAVGEDFRAGRWWWEGSDLKECGLHVEPAMTFLPPSETSTA